MRKYGRTGNGPIFYIALAVVVYALISVAIGMATLNDCDDFPDREWRLFPPGWECVGSSS